MGQPGDAAAQPPQAPAAPQGDEQPMRAHDAPSAMPDAPTIADEVAPEDETTQIVPQASLQPPAATPPKQSGAPRPAQPANTPAPRPPTPAAGATPWQGGPHVVPVVGGSQGGQAGQAGQRPPLPQGPIHAPWHTAASWGATTFVITAETAAGFSYLFWWISGLLVYFNERENRYVRFHAVQSILLTSILSVFSVFAYTTAAIFNDLFMSSHQAVWQTLATGVTALSLLIVLVPWLFCMIAAWTGTYLQLPIIGDYAERFAAPPVQLRP